MQQTFSVSLDGENALPEDGGQEWACLWVPGVGVYEMRGPGQPVAAPQDHAPNTCV